MKPSILAEIERIAGDRLTPAMREEITDRAIKIIDDHNRAAALTAVEAVKKTIVQESKEAAAKEPNGPK